MCACVRVCVCVHACVFVNRMRAGESMTKTLTEISNQNLQCNRSPEPVDEREARRGEGGGWLGLEREGGGIERGEERERGCREMGGGGDGGG